MATFNIYKGTGLTTTKVPVKDGQLLFETDTKKIWLDSGAVRLQMGGQDTIAWSSVTGKPSYYDAKAIKSISRNGTTFTYTCLDGSTGTFTQQDNNTTYSAGTGISLSGTTFSLNVSGAKTALGLGSNAYTSTAYLPLTGGTMTGAINFSGEIPLTWNDGTYFQRIAITDDSEVNTPVFQFQQSINSGSSWDNLFTIRDNGTVLATLFSGSGASLTALNASNVSSGVLSVKYGGTGQTTAQNAANALLTSLTTGSSTPVDADYIITQWVEGGTSNRDYVQRPISTIWNYIKGKTDNFYLPSSGGNLTGDLNLITGNSDRFITFRYKTATTEKGASWRMGYLGSGSGDANYLVFQTTSSTTGSSETWENALRLGMNSKTAYFFGQVVVNFENDSVAKTANTGSLIIGSPTGNHISIDSNEIMAKSSGTTTGTLHLNHEGGKIQCGSGGLYGAVWNDYAEFRTTVPNAKPGQVVIENGDGSLRLSTERLQPGCEIVSDTFGFAIGETDECKTPIAASGRVLAYPYEDRDTFVAGEAVCSGPNGTVSRMTREEVMMYPERIIGTVSEIPSYERWGSGDVEVNGRIWIRIR